MEPGSLRSCTAGRIRNHSYKLELGSFWLEVRKNFSPCGQLSPGTDSPERLWSLHPWKGVSILGHIQNMTVQIPEQTALNSWPCSDWSNDVRSLPTLVFLLLYITKFLAMLYPMLLALSQISPPGCISYATLRDLPLMQNIIADLLQLSLGMIKDVLFLRCWQTFSLRKTLPCLHKRGV